MAIRRQKVPLSELYSVVSGPKVELIRALSGALFYWNFSFHIECLNKSFVNLQIEC